MPVRMQRIATEWNRILDAPNIFKVSSWHFRNVYIPYILFLYFYVFESLQLTLEGCCWKKKPKKKQRNFPKAIDKEDSDSEWWFNLHGQRQFFFWTHTLDLEVPCCPQWTGCFNDFNSARNPVEIICIRKKKRSCWLINQQDLFIELYYFIDRFNIDIIGPKV